MRLFIGIFLPEEIKTQVAKIIQQLKEYRFNAKYVEKENLHITLKFLGEVDDKLVFPIKDALFAVANTTQRFFLSLSSCIDAFPSLQRPRVIWIGIKEGKEELNQLAKKINEALSGFFPKEDFKAHLTIARLRSIQNIASLASKFSFNIVSFYVFNFSLVQSTLTEKGPLYKQLYSFGLNP